jgi:hypothetical protein
LLLVGKALAVVDADGSHALARPGPQEQAGCCALERVGAAIAASEVLNDPQELRPLPLSGIPGWHPASDADGFYASAACFRPLRPGRSYPAPLKVSDLRTPLSELDSALEGIATARRA